MLFLLGYGQVRPDRFEMKERDETYHLLFARYCASAANSWRRNDFLRKTEINKLFYKNQQWVFEEDTELFFKDDTGQNRNRLKFTQNIIRPMVNTYKSSASKMQINATVKSVSPMVINRREESLSRMLFMTDLARDKNPFKDDIKKKYPIGETPQETEQIHENLFIDKNTEIMNDLLRYVADNSQFPMMQMRLAEEVALSGIGVIQDYAYGGNQCFDIVPSEEYFWDPSSKKYDLSDGEYMGRIRMMLPTEIFEEFNVDDKLARETIEQYSRLFAQSIGTDASVEGNSTRTPGSRVPVIFAYWKDFMECEYGYVMDEFGYPYLTKINYTYPGEEQPRYTDKDLIEVKTIRSEQVLDGKKKKRLVYEVLRKCFFIPKEITGVMEEKNTNKYHDVVLEYGIESYQETDNQHITTVKFPFKVHCWGYVDGEVVSPVDDAINPQRFINRLLSVSENQINNAGGVGTFYDKSFIDPAGGEDELLRNMNQSKPVALNVKGRGIQNGVGRYDNTGNIKSSLDLFTMVGDMDNMVGKVTGMNDAMTGANANPNQLVGVTDALLQRGTLVQEPFFFAIENIFLQCFQSIASRGKRIYADNERELCIAVGDEGAKLIKITKDMKLEDFRSFVTRSNTDDTLYGQGNTMLMTMLQMGLIDDTKFANLFGRSTPEMVAIALRQAAKERQEMGRVKKKEEVAQGQALQQAQAQEAQAQTANEDKMIAVNTESQDRAAAHKMNEIYAKGATKIAEKQVVPPQMFQAKKKETAK